MSSCAPFPRTPRCATSRGPGTTSSRRASTGSRWRCSGILLTSIRKPLTRLARTLLAQVGNEKAFRREDGTPLKFETDISLGVALQESQAARQTLFQYEPDHLICEQYRAVVREMEARIRDRERGVLVPQPRTVLPTMPVVVGEEELQAGEAGNG